MNYGTIADCNYNDIPEIKKRKIMDLPNKMPRVDQLVYFWYETNNMSVHDRILLKGNLFEKAFFLY